MTTPNIEELIDRLYDWHNTSAEQNRLDMQKAADLLQSQAERIKELESEVEMWKATANAVVDFEKVQLRAEIAAIAATEPVFYEYQWTNPGNQPHQPESMFVWARVEPAWNGTVQQKVDELLAYRYDDKPTYRVRALYPSPMPAQRLTELKLLMLTTAYEQGVGKGTQRRDCNPYAADTDEHAAWKLGYEEGLDKPMPAKDAEIEKTEPVAYMVQFSPGSRWVELTKEEFDSDLDGHIVYKKQAFFTHPMPAESKDAERYRWLRDYLISPSTHFDDLIVSADKAETLNGVIDAARAKGTK